MTQNAVVRARIDGPIKTEAEAVIASIGLIVSTAFCMMMVRIATEKALPFESHIPDSESIEAMKAAWRRELRQAEPAGHLLVSLNAGD
jgi:DNA-damage-inducible protein J